MNISKRTKMSLSDLISLFYKPTIFSLMEKHNLSYRDDYDECVPIDQVILQAHIDSISNLFGEIVRRSSDLRFEVSPKYRFDERWHELELCLLLDGYRIERNEIHSIEPSIEGNIPIEDDLTKELRLSALDGYEEIIRLMESSARLFIHSTPDYNGCLTNARIALETLVRNIAENMGHVLEDRDSKRAWGSSLSYLKTHNFLTKQQEETISSVYTLVSSGCHRPLGLTDEEYTRFGRNLVTSMCYFIAKRLTGSNNLHNS